MGLFDNPVADLSSIAQTNMPELSKLNLDHTHVTNVTPLFDFASLTDLIIRLCG